jgi:Rrf2 family iron-sulfur cluster assembly transcriptional regulator
MRLEITRKTDLALKAMIVLGDSEARLKGGALAEQIDTTPGFISQILAPLVREAWVESAPGRNGGYRLRVDLEDVSLLDLIEAVEGPSESDRCVLRGTPCPAVEKCALHDPWTRARIALLRELALTCLSEIESGKGVVES